MQSLTAVNEPRNDGQLMKRSSPTMTKRMELILVGWIAMVTLVHWRDGIGVEGVMISRTLADVQPGITVLNDGFRFYFFRSVVESHGGADDEDRRDDSKCLHWENENQ